MRVSQSQFRGANLNLYSSSEARVLQKMSAHNEL